MSKARIDPGKPSSSRGSGARTLARKVLAALWADKVTMFALVCLSLMSLAALFPGLLATHDFASQDLLVRNQPPLTPSAADGATHVLGTDALGRDVYSRLVHGARVSLAVGLSSVVVSGAFGIFLGLVAGYFRGRLDDMIMRLADLQMGFPGLLLALLVLFVIGPGFVNVILVMAVIRWPIYCRVTRGLTMSLREASFIEAARSIGCGDVRILRYHMLPNLVSPLIVLATLELARMILLEASMSFLGLGIQPPAASWGLQLSQGADHIRSAWWLVAAPGLAIFFAALSVNLVATWLRVISDPGQRWVWLAGKRRGREAAATDDEEGSRR